jgi:hypothetical protein
MIQTANQTHSQSTNINAKVELRKIRPDNGLPAKITRKLS